MHRHCYSTCTLQKNFAHITTYVPPSLLINAMYLISGLSDASVLHRKPAPGMMSTLMYGICILLGQFTAKDELWQTVRQSALFSLAPYALVVLVSFYRTDCWQNTGPTRLAYASYTLPWPPYWTTNAFLTYNTVRSASIIGLTCTMAPSPIAPQLTD